MKTPVRVALSLAAASLLACGVEAEPAPEERAPVQVPAPVGGEGLSVRQGDEPRVSAAACTTLWRPRYSSYWSSFPIEVDGEMGGCETHDDCTTTCWGVETPYYIHQNFFYCTYCR